VSSRSRYAGRLPGEVDIAANIADCVRALHYLAAHAIEAFPHRRGVAIDSVLVRTRGSWKGGIERLKLLWCERE
jgi:hypothetical protein